MNPLRYTRGLALVILVAFGLVLTACSGESAQSNVAKSGADRPQQTATQTSEGGQVTLKVTLQGDATAPVFNVAMDTHSVDLDGYDLAQLAMLRTDDGHEVQPTAWEAPKGGHHRSGTLTFPTTTEDGRAVIGPETRAIELVIRDVAGVPERVLRWTL